MAKRTLPADRPMRTLVDVKAWLAELHARDLLWHMDDSVDTVVWGHGWKPSKAELALLAKQQDNAWAVTSKAGVDLHELCHEAMRPVCDLYHPHPGATDYEDTCASCERYGSDHDRQPCPDCKQPVRYTDAKGWQHERPNPACFMAGMVTPPGGGR